jgi:5'-3' exonuclease
MRALIDGDVVRYRTGFASEGEEEWIACSRADTTIEKILADTGANDYTIFFSDSLENNYRYKLYPFYKSSRQKTPKPKHHWALGKFIEDEWGVTVAKGEEADDALGITQSQALEELRWAGDEPTIICSIDKDLLQVPGKHYNFVKGEFIEVDYLSGLRSFYRQLLTGDRTDDIPGIRGIGPVKAARLIDHLETEEEMVEVVRGMWQDDEKVDLYGKLLWVRREPEQLWRLPIPQDTEVMSSSLQTKPREIDPSLEPITTQEQKPSIL